VTVMVGDANVFWNAPAVIVAGTASNGPNSVYATTSLVAERAVSSTCSLPSPPRHASVNVAVSGDVAVAWFAHVSRYDVAPGKSVKLTSIGNAPFSAGSRGATTSPGWSPRMLR